MTFLRRSTSCGGAPPAREDLPPDVFVVPGLLLLVARDLLLFDPPRVLAWRLLHDPRLAATPSWLAPLLPRPSGALDRDPLALMLGAVLVGLAIAYGLVGLVSGRRAVRTRGWLLGVSGLLLVVVPTVAFVCMGFASQRPFGQDGGVVQLPLAMDRILAGRSPYGADYSDSILGKQARVSDFWEEWGGNPILHHHAYLPGTHLLMAPAYLVFRGTLGVFDPRMVTLAAFAVAALLALRICGGGSAGLLGAALVVVNPLVYWQQIFGAGDVLVAALLLGAVLLAKRGRCLAAAVVLGLACATKQLAWPYAPFLLVHLSGARSFHELAGRDARRRLGRFALVATATFALFVVPVAALDFRAFWGDIIAYNAGLRGGDNYPLGGTPGFGFANFLIYFGRVASLSDYFPFGLFYLLLVPLGFLLLKVQMRDGGAALGLVTGSAALVASVYFSRVAHPNYLILVAILLPVGAVACRRPAPDVVIVPLLLLMLGVEIAENQIFRKVWEDALSVRMPAHVSGALQFLLPRAGPGLTRDPLGLLLSALASGMGVAWLWAGLLGTPARARRALAVVALALLAVVPTLVVVRVGERSGVPRGQDAWLANVEQAVGQASGQRPGPPLREAWSRSFRRDPPQELEAGSRAPGEGFLAVLLRLLGRPDPRILSLVALGLVTMLLLRGAAAETQVLALGVIALSPLAVTGLVFGAGEMLALVGLLAFKRLQDSGRWLTGGLVLGSSLAVFPRLLFCAPFLVSRSCAGEPRRRWLRLGSGALVGALLASVPSGGLGKVLAWPWAPGVSDGLGLSNIIAYWGGSAGGAGFALLELLVGLLCLVVAGAIRMPEDRRVIAAGIALLAGLWVMPGASANDLGVPLAFLLLSFLVRAHVPASDTPEALPGAPG